MVVRRKKSNQKQGGSPDDLVKLTAIDQDVLTVGIGNELYGLEILTLLNQDRPIPLSFGSLYPALTRLEKKELLTCRWGDAMEESGGARRKYYKVTGLGARSLRAVQEYRSSLSKRSGQGAMEGV